MIKLFAIKLTENDEDILLDKMSLLSLEIRERLEKYKVKRDRALSCSAKLMLFTFAHTFKNDEYTEVNLVTDYDVFNEDSVKNFDITYDEYGKSYVGDKSDIYFNISHSGEYCVLALSDENVGVDIQQARKVNLRIAEKWFNEKENEYIKGASTEDEALMRFARIWSAKESYAKYTGKGLSEPFTKFYEDFDAGFVVENTDNKRVAKLSAYLIDERYFCHVSSPVK